MREAAKPTPAADEVLRVVDLTKHYPVGGGFGKRPAARVHAVNGVSFSLFQGETLSVVGESGCGKSTVGRAILKLVEPTSGRIFARGVDVTQLGTSAMRPHRRHLQMVFQDPFSSLNPRMTAGEIVAEPMRIHRSVPRRELRPRVEALFEKVGLAATALDKYAHEFSGGQRQRIAIARALSLDPDVIVCDEAVSALDVSIQAQVLNLLVDLQRDLKIAYLFITHDLSVVRYLSHRVAVMYLGKIVEIAPKEAIFAEPLHPYTSALMSAAPLPDPEADRGGRNLLSGEVPSAINPPSGCYFRTRCPFAMPVCASVEPVLREVRPGHHAACHLNDDSGPDHQTADGRGRSSRELELSR